MSMKRTKQTSRGRSRDEDVSSPFGKKAPEKSYTWDDDVAGQPDEAFKAYNLKESFARGALLLHPTFGKGVVTLVEGTRVEVLFQAGPKKLGHKG